MLRTRSRSKYDSPLNMAPTLYALKSPTSNGQGQVVVVYDQEIPQEVRNHPEAWRCSFQLTEAEAQEVATMRRNIKSTETYSRALQWSQPQGQASGPGSGSTASAPTSAASPRSRKRPPQAKGPVLTVSKGLERMDGIAVSSPDPAVDSIHGELDNDRGGDRGMHFFCCYFL